MTNWINNKVAERTPWAGAALIAVGVVILFAGPFAKTVGIGEHSDLTAEMDKWIGEIASNQDKIDAIDELNENKDKPPKQGDLFRETSRW